MKLSNIGFSNIGFSMECFTADFPNFLPRPSKFVFWMAGKVLSHQFQAFQIFP